MAETKRDLESQLQAAQTELYTLPPFDDDVVSARKDILSARIGWLKAQLAETKQEVKPDLLQELRDALYNHRYKQMPVALAEELIEKIDRSVNSHALLVEALEKLISYNMDIVAGRINYRPEDHIEVALAALQAAKQGR